MSISKASFLYTVIQGPTQLQHLPSLTHDSKGCSGIISIAAAGKGRVWRIISWRFLRARPGNDLCYFCPIPVAMTQSHSCSYSHGASVGSLKQQPLPSSQFSKSEVHVGLGGSLIRISSGWNQEIGQLKLLSETLGKNSPLSSFRLSGEFDSWQC